MVKGPNNPILTLGAAGAFDVSDLANPDVFFDPVANRWVLTYSGYSSTIANPGGGTGFWQLGFAYSASLLGTWTKEANNPIGTAPLASDGYIKCNGSVVYKAGTYYHFFQRSSGPGGSGTQGLTPAILLETTTSIVNGGTWTRSNSGNPVLSAGTTGSYDAGGVCDPSVKLMADGVTFECLYNAYLTAAATTRTVRRATSTDGVTWTKDTSFGGLAYPPWTDHGDCGEPNFLRTGAGLHVGFDGSTSATYRRRGRAFSTDNGASWSIRFPSLSPGTGWEAAQVLDSCWVVSAGKLYEFYAASPNVGQAQGMGFQLGLATADLLADAI